jgi:hypothetical protein
MSDRAVDVVKVRLLVSRAGHNFDANGRLVGTFSQAIGEIVEMPREEARRHVERGLAIKVDTQQLKG